jgi:hypothetical protein
MGRQFNTTCEIGSSLSSTNLSSLLELLSSDEFLTTSAHDCIIWSWLSGSGAIHPVSDLVFLPFTNMFCIMAICGLVLAYGE